MLGVEAEIEGVRRLGLGQLRTRWRALFGATPPPAFTKDLLARRIVWHIQEQALGGLDRAMLKQLARLVRGDNSSEGTRRLKVGTVLVREYQGARHTVTVVPGGFVWRETTYASLSTIARAITGTGWNGPRFFGLRIVRDRGHGGEGKKASANPEGAGEGTPPAGALVATGKGAATETAGAIANKAPAGTARAALVHSRGVVP
jgi:hypothetical protein